MKPAKSFLNKNKPYPNKLLGQNFLHSIEYRQKIIEAAELSPEDTVIEVGAGDGSLTLEIAKKAKLVLAVEKDKRFASLLQKIITEQKINPPIFYTTIDPDEKYLEPPLILTAKPRSIQKDGGVKNIIVINEDILKLNLATYLCEIRPSENVIARSKATKQSPKNRFTVTRNDELKNYKLIGNIPYYLTSRLLRKFLADEKHKPREIILTVQKEVAERITAHPPHMNLLALSVQAYGKPEIVEKIPAEAFWPKPKVDSAIIKISEISEDFFTKNKIDQKKFFTLIKTAFSQKRKTLANSLTRFFGNKKIAEEKIKKAGFANKSRPEELTLKDWTQLNPPLQQK